MASDSWRLLRNIIKMMQLGETDNWQSAKVTKDEGREYNIIKSYRGGLWNLNIVKHIATCRKP